MHNNNHWDVCLHLYALPVYLLYCFINKNNLYCVLCGFCIDKNYDIAPLHCSTFRMIVRMLNLRKPIRKCAIFPAFFSVLPQPLIFSLKSILNEYISLGNRSLSMSRFKSVKLYKVSHLLGIFNRHVTVGKNYDIFSWNQGFLENSMVNHTSKALMHIIMPI